MKNDSLKQYVSLRDALQAERETLIARLQQIEAALGGAVTSSAPVKGKRGPKPGKRARNEMSLKEAVLKVTTGKSLTKDEILAGIRKLGYKFTAKDPVNSLNTVLYSKGQFKNDGGKFSPAK